MLTLPASIVSEALFDNLAADLLTAVVNALLLFFLISRLKSSLGVTKTATILIILLLFASAAAWFFNEQDQEARVRIVNGGPKVAGVWVATNDNGLRALSQRPLINSPFGIPTGIPENTPDESLVLFLTMQEASPKGADFSLRVVVWSSPMLQTRTT